MRFAISSAQLQFFLQHHYIEFDDLITAQDVATLKENGQALVAKRLKTSPSKLNQFSNTDLFMAGRDSWRENSEAQKILFRPKLGQIATTLFQEKHLQMGYDQWIQTSAAPSPIDQFFSLEQISSFNHISGGLIINLGTPLEITGSYVFCPVPKKPGSGLFLSPKLLLDWKTLFNTPHLELLLLVYCPMGVRYTLNSHDPHVHALKRKGYVFGDQVSTLTHPLLYRS
jgi:hypothetical protein